MTSTIFDEARQITVFADTGDLKDILDNLDKRSIIPSFRRTSDPINLAFNYIENKPLKTLAKDFIKDTVADIISFITKASE